jgi:ABC-type branched-subunit amino acid transport system ATPase component
MFGGRLPASLDRGITTVLVEHDLDLVMGVCDVAGDLGGGTVCSS